MPCAGKFVDGAAMMASDSEESDMFKGPISVDICNNSTTQVENMVT